MLSFRLAAVPFSFGYTSDVGADGFVLSEQLGDRAEFMLRVGMWVRRRFLTTRRDGRARRHGFSSGGLLRCKALP